MSSKISLSPVSQDRLVLPLSNSISWFNQIKQGENLILKCHALVITCLDYRIQEAIIDWLGENVGHGNYNRVALAGGVKNWPVIFEQIDLSKRVQDIEQVIIIHHEDCRAYGEAGTFERHSADMHAARDEVKKKYPDMQVDLYFVRLNGALEPVA